MTKYHPAWTDKDGKAYYYCGNCSTPGTYYGKPKKCRNFAPDGGDCDIPIVDEKDLLLINELLAPCDLAEFAAWDAAKALVSNWLSALRDGSDIEPLILDVAQVIQVLIKWQIRLTQKYVNKEMG